MGCGDQCDSSSLKKMFSYLIPIWFVLVAAVFFKTNRRDHKRGYYHEGLGGLYRDTKRSGLTKITREENPTKFLFRISWMYAASVLFIITAFVCYNMFKY